jgi:hypothetical protein
MDYFLLKYYSLIFFFAKPCSLEHAVITASRSSRERFTQYTSARHLQGAGHLLLACKLWLGTHTDGLCSISVSLGIVKIIDKYYHL